MQNTQNRRTLDFSFLVSEFFRHVVVVCYVPKLIFPELGNRPRWEKTLVQNGPRQRGEKNPLNLVQPISQPNLAQCTLCWQFDDQKGIYLALRGISAIRRGHFYDAEAIFNY